MERWCGSVIVSALHMLIVTLSARIRGRRGTMFSGTIISPFSSSILIEELVWEGVSAVVGVVMRGRGVEVAMVFMARRNKTF